MQPVTARPASTSATALVDRIRQHDVRAIARAISMLEDDAAEAREIQSACFPFTGSSLTMGITGSPGAGKSSLVDQLCRSYLQQSSRVGVLAVDPSSPYSGGALLGDRIRMQEHHANPDFYLRSMATRGSLGGLAHTTAGAVSILDAAGFDRVMIETVGVGQDEVDIMRLADITIVVLVPGMGDDVQSIKAGIMEVADIFVINKSDREGADRLEAEVRSMQSLASSHAERVPAILKTTATTGDGIPALIAAIEDYAGWLAKNDRLASHRTAQWGYRLREMVRQELLQGASAHGLGDRELAIHAASVVSRKENPFEIVPVLVANLLPR